VGLDGFLCAFSAQNLRRMPTATYGKKAGAHSLILLDSMPYITIGVSE
jgi:hypothetical protein